MAVGSIHPLLLSIPNPRERLKQRLTLALSCMRSFKKETVQTLIVEDTKLPVVLDAVRKLYGPGLTIEHNGEIVEALFNIPTDKCHVHIAVTFQGRVWICFVRTSHLLKHLLERAQDMSNSPWAPVLPARAKQRKRKTGITLGVTGILPTPPAVVLQLPRRGALNA